MKSIFKSILLVGALTIGASGLFASPAGNNWINHQYRAKLGRNTPSVDAEMQAQQANSAYRAAPAKLHKVDYLKQDFREKLGRTVYPPRTASERAADLNSAYRQQPKQDLQQTPQQIQHNYLREKRGITANR